MRIARSGNERIYGSGNDIDSRWENPTTIFYSPLASGRRFVHHFAISPQLTYYFQSFYFSTIDVQFSVELFFCRSTVDDLHLHFIVLLHVFGNGREMGITQWKSHGSGNKTNLGMGMGRNWN